MGNKRIDIGTFQAVALKQLLAKFSLFTNRELEDLLPVLMDIMHLLLHGINRGWIQAAAARHVEILASGAVDFMDEINEAHRLVVSRLENDGASPITEYHACRAVGEIDDRRHHVGADDHHPLMRSAGNELRPGLQRVDESRAGTREIKAPQSLGPKFVLHETCRRGKKHVGSNSSKDRKSVV